MIRIVNIGMNHETAPVELRECLAREPGNTAKALVSMRELECINEGLFLSTCNRVEALYITENPTEARRAVLSLLSQLGNMSQDQFSGHMYSHEDREATRHIFRVASSLDSLVKGEPQILGQIKEAYHEATTEKTVGVILNKLLHKAFQVAKRVRTETGVSDAAVSISYAAVQLAKKIFYDLNGKKVLLIGAGEMAELAARHLLNQGVSAITVANRTFERAVQLAKTFDGKPVSFEEIGSQIFEADIAITSTASSEFVIRYDQIKDSLRKRRNRPLFIIDIAVPRDVEPRVNDLENVYVYDIDDLKGIIEVNVAQREHEALKAERIVAEEVIRFEEWRKTLDVVPTIVSLQEKAETVRQAEIKKRLAAMGNLTPSQIKAIEDLTLSITKKIINDPIVTLKKTAHEAARDLYLDVIRNLFKL